MKSPAPIGRGDWRELKPSRHSRLSVAVAHLFKHLSRLILAELGREYKAAGGLCLLDRRAG